MEYNSQRGIMAIPEYGRNIHKMIEFTVNIKDREKRNKAANAIVAIMGQLNPHLRDYTDFKHKLWDHLFIISNFKLEVDSPYPIPSEATLTQKPKKIPYPTKNFKFRHYGRTIELIINEIIKLEEGPAKEEMIEKIANFMKMSYLSWNRDSVSDELILEHLKVLSGGKLELNASARLHLTSDILAKTAKKPVPVKQGKNFKRHDGGKRRSGRK